MFCWGDDNNSQETIKFMKSIGCHGIIYDRMDQLSTKTEKVSQFRKGYQEMVQTQRNETELGKSFFNLFY